MTAVDWHDRVNSIQDRGGFVSLVRDLVCELKDRPSAWENQDLATYLDALAAWVEDMDGYFQHKGEHGPEQPSWKLLGQILVAARVYE